MVLPSLFGVVLREWSQSDIMAFMAFALNCLTFVTQM